MRLSKTDFLSSSLDLIESGKEGRAKFGVFLCVALVDSA